MTSKELRKKTSLAFKGNAGALVAANLCPAFAICVAYFVVSRWNASSLAGSLAWLFFNTLLYALSLGVVGLCLAAWKGEPVQISAVFAFYKSKELLRKSVCIGVVFAGISFLLSFATFQVDTIFQTVMAAPQNGGLPLLLYCALRVALFWLQFWLQYRLVLVAYYFVDSPDKNPIFYVSKSFASMKCELWNLLAACLPAWLRSTAMFLPVLILALFAMRAANLQASWFLNHFIVLSSTLLYAVFYAPVGVATAGFASTLLTQTAKEEKKTLRKSQHHEAK